MFLRLNFNLQTENVYSSANFNEFKINRCLHFKKGFIQLTTEQQHVCLKKEIDYRRKATNYNLLYLL